MYILFTARVKMFQESYSTFTQVFAAGEIYVGSISRENKRHLAFTSDNGFPADNFGKAIFSFVEFCNFVFRASLKYRILIFI